WRKSLPMKRSQTARRPWYSSNIAIAAVLFFLTFAAYEHVTESGEFDFVNFDDTTYVRDNEHVKNRLTGENVRWAFTTFASANCHPLTWLTLQLDAALYGSSATGYHVTNVLLHAVNAVLLFVLVSQTAGARWQSAFVAALFALHPAHVESVAWIFER